MLLIANILRRACHWLLRIRHRCGYGIHSPFAFSFVTDVIYSPGTFYAYADIEKCLASHGDATLRAKDGKLLMRLANFVRPDVCCVWGISLNGAEISCLAAGSQHTQFTDSLTKANMIVARQWTEHVDALLTHLNEGGMLVLFDISSTSRRQRAWRWVKQQPQACITFDLYHFGIVIFRTDLCRQHYVINYF